jgi:hypothetical protein
MEVLNTSLPPVADDLCVFTALTSRPGEARQTHIEHCPCHPRGINYISELSGHARDRLRAM